MDYTAALDYIAATGRFGVKLGLERTRALLDALGSPDQGFKGVLVGGTNGKGSTCAYLVSILREAGYRVGSMPKPHLQSYTERICVDGVPITEAEFAAIVTALEPVVRGVAREHGDPTEFEMLTAAAVRHLRDRDIDYLVCEVGMGGRLDSTNVLDLGVKVITNVELDHTQYLGPDRASIAAEKAGILRAGDAVVTGRLHAEAAPVVAARAAAVGASLTRQGRDFRAAGVRSGWRGTTFDLVRRGSRTNRLHTSLLGAHQASNAALAVAAAEAMRQRHGARISAAAVRAGLRYARWPGRLELVRGGARDPDIIIDGAHNPAAVDVAVAAVRSLLRGGAREVVVLLGAMADKDHAMMLRALPRRWPAILTAVDNKRALAPAELLRESMAAGRRDRAVDGVAAALAAARAEAGARGLVVVLGSLYLAGAVRAELGLRFS